MSNQKTVEFLITKIGEGEWDITVIVKGVRDLAPVRGMKVTMSSIGSRKTDKKGLCQFEGVPEGTYEVSCEKRRYISQIKTLTLPPK